MISVEMRLDTRINRKKEIIFKYLRLVNHENSEWMMTLHVILVHHGLSCNCYLSDSYMVKRCQANQRDG